MIGSKKIKLSFKYLGAHRCCVPLFVFCMYFPHDLVQTDFDVLSGMPLILLGPV